MDDPLELIRNFIWPQAGRIVMYTYLAKLGFWSAMSMLILMSAAANAQNQYFGEFDGNWDDPFAWEGGIVPGVGESAFLVRPYFGIVPAIQPVLVNYQSATDPQLGALVIESSNWLIQSENPGFDSLTSFFEVVGGYNGPLTGLVEQVDNPAHRTSHIQSGGTNTVQSLLTIGGITGSGGRYQLSGGVLGTGGTILADSGLGEFEQTGGTHSTGAFAIGLGIGSTGSLNFEGGELDVAGSFTVGATGSGSVYHTGDATATIGGSLVLGENPGGNGEYEFDATSTMNVLGDLQVRRGEFRHLGGRIETGGDLVVETGGLYQMTTSSAFQNITGRLDVSGQFDLQRGRLDVGRELNIHAGTFDQSAGDVLANQNLRIGDTDGETANYYLRTAEAVLQVNENVYIGTNGGTGSFTHEDGLHQIGDALVLGYEATFEPLPIVLGGIGIGNYTISGEESIERGLRAARLHIGDSGMEPAAGETVSTFDQNGGDVRFDGEIVIGKGIYNLRDGTLRCNKLPEDDQLRLLYYGENALIVGGKVSGNDTTGDGFAFGLFFQTGGQNLVNGDLTIGAHDDAGGVYELSGGTLDIAGDLTTKSIGAASGSYIQLGAIAEVSGDVTNNGDFLLSRFGTMNVAGSFTNNGEATIRTGSTLTTSGDTFMNFGSLNVEGAGTNTINGPVENYSDVNIVETNVNFNGIFTNQGALVSTDSESIFDKLIVGQNGYLQGGDLDRFVIRSDFDNASQQDEVWDTRHSTLEFNGEVAHLFGLAGDDQGANFGGFEDNFAWGELSLAIGQTLTLLDGNSDLGAALYLGLLTLHDLDQLNSIFSDFNIYYDARLSGNQYLGGQTFALSGAGRLIPVAIPEPGSLLLIFLASAACLVCRKR